MDAPLELKTPDYAALIAAEVGISPRSVSAVIALLDDGATVPFIARYRKEATAGADDATIARTQELVAHHREFFERKTTILHSIHEQGKLTPELRAAIEAATTRALLEDLYLPYRPKRRTRATIAREKGLEPLSERMWAQADAAGTPEEIARAFVDAEKGVESADDALAGARDIVAERIVENAAWRAALRELAWSRGRVTSRAARGKAETKSKFTDYYDFSEGVTRIPSHRLLAILRGESEGFLSHHIGPDGDEARALLRSLAVKKAASIWRSHMEQASDDAWDRLLSGQLETEIRAELKLKADESAIDVFATNLRELLLAPPFGASALLAIDPGFRTGCKVVILGPTGTLRDHGVVHPTEPRADIEGTHRALDRWLDKFKDIACIAIGNGTGGRETFAVVNEYVKARGKTIAVVLVNEAGASVYSASEVARAELPNHDVTVRGAVSIGRRLQDPLSELVKIDPKAIGVGQYQHDVDQKRLKEKLDQVVVACVNHVGVDVNTASAPLLQYVSGLSARTAHAIVARRDAEGPFRSRNEFRKVPGLGPKTFEQAAGFLRVKGDNPLDNSAVHPERYALVERIARDHKRSVATLIGDAAAVRAIDIDRYADDTVGLFTLRDIIGELEKPGRDPRDDFEVTGFRDDVQKIEDLKKDMVLNGIVTNVTHFGAFVDVGVHQDGLVHVSRVSDRYVTNPADVLHVGQRVRVRVLDIDLERGRISLSIRDA
ncbi:MAG TPA: Tex family protein [Candidatus Krumholzibacteria bacterium]